MRIGACAQLAELVRNTLGTLFFFRRADQNNPSLGLDHAPNTLNHQSKPHTLNHQSKPNTLNHQSAPYTLNHEPKTSMYTMSLNHLHPSTVLLKP